MSFGWGAVAQGAMELIGGERQRDINQRDAANQRQAEEREAERNRAFLADQSHTARAMAQHEARLQREFNAHEATVQRDWSGQQAQALRDWQEGMSNTAHQREIRDLRAAGLNPILSGTGGMGSHTPAGAMPSGQAATSGAAPATAAGGSKGNMALGHAAQNTIANAVASARAAKMNEAQVDLINAQEKNVQWDTKKKTEETGLIYEQYETQRNITKQAKHQAEILSNSAKGSEIEGEIDETKYGEIMRYINRALRAITGGSSAYRNFQHQ